MNDRVLLRTWEPVPMKLQGTEVTLRSDTFIISRIESFKSVYLKKKKYIIFYYFQIISILNTEPKRHFYLLSDQKGIVLQNLSMYFIDTSKKLKCFKN